MFLCLALVCAMPRAAQFHGALEGVAEGEGEGPMRLLARTRLHWQGDGHAAALRFTADPTGPARLYALYGERRRGPWRLRAGRLPVALHTLDGARLDWHRGRRHAWAYGGRPRRWDDLIEQTLPARAGLGLGQGAWSLEGQWPAALEGRGRWRGGAPRHGWRLDLVTRLHRGLARLQADLTLARGDDRLRLGLSRRRATTPPTTFRQGLALAYAPGTLERLQAGWSRRLGPWAWDAASAYLRHATGAGGGDYRLRFGHRAGLWRMWAEARRIVLGREWRQGLALDLDLRPAPRWRLTLAAAVWRGATTLAGTRTDLAAELRLRHRPASNQRLDLRLGLAAGTPTAALAWERRFQGAGP